jgi:hypothetical protein
MAITLLREIRRRSARKGVDYPILYIPTDVMKLLGFKIGDKVVLYVPNSKDHIEIWPHSEFMKRMRMGFIK